MFTFTGETAYGLPRASFAQYAEQVSAERRRHADLNKRYLLAFYGLAFASGVSFHFGYFAFGVILAAVAMLIFVGSMLEEHTVNVIDSNKLLAALIYEQAFRHDDWTSSLEAAFDTLRRDLKFPEK